MFPPSATIGLGPFCPLKSSPPPDSMVAQDWPLSEKGATREGRLGDGTRGLIRSRIVGATLATLVLGGQTLTSLPATAAAPGGPIVIHSLKNDVSAPLRDEQGQVGPNGPYNQGHRALRSGNLNTNGPSSAGQVQTSPGPPAMPSTSTNFEGGSNAENAVAVLPPDPTGA